MRQHKKSWPARLFRWSVRKWFARQGWTVERQVPVERKFVIIAVPHTSNWDFPHFLGLADELDLDLSFMGKLSLFRWPFAGVMRELGGIPVDRKSANNAVDQMVAEFAKRDSFMLTIAPEGTRGKVREWRTGFYHIALAAGVPIVCGLMDYAKKHGGLGPAIYPTGDYEADMKKIVAVYKGVTPKYPERTAITQMTAN